MQPKTMRLWLDWDFHLGSGRNFDVHPAVFSRNVAPPDNCLIRMTRDSGHACPPALQINEKQHVVRNQSSERKLLGYQLVPMEQDAA